MHALHNCIMKNIEKMLHLKMKAEKIVPLETIRRIYPKVAVMFPLRIDNGGLECMYP